MQVLLNLLAAVALLVWGTHIVRGGILRIYGAGLRRVLSQSIHNRSRAFLAGLGVTTLIQSSTATALITTSFVGSGLIATAPALAIMLGADVGTALLAVVFSLDLSLLSPLLITVGVFLFVSQHNSKAGQLGGVAIGLGLMILSLKLIVMATQPLTQAAGVRVIFASLTGDVVLDVLVGALFTLTCYSSLAIILFTAALAASGMIPTDVALALVLGANLGSGLLAVLATLKSTPEARRVGLGNFLFRFLGCVALLPLLDYAGHWVAAFDPEPQRQVVNFHLAFNALIAITFMSFTPWVARWCEKWLPSQPAGENGGTPRYLDPVALGTPTLAISCAAREALRLGDVIETMLRGTLSVLRDNDLKLAMSIRRMDDDADRLYTAIKFYLTQISREALEEKESRRWADIMSLTINLEHVGDIIDKNLMELAEKKIKKSLSFSEAGLAEICDLHARLLANLQLGLNVFINGDLKSAQKLLSEKEHFRDLGRAYAETHLQRLADKSLLSVESSAVHLDVIRDMKRINSHMCSIAYPILEQAGVLRPSRLRGEFSGEEAGAAATVDPKISMNSRKINPVLGMGKGDGDKTALA